MWLCCSEFTQDNVVNHWIGLTRGDLVCSCNTAVFNCLQCRESWLWQDGTLGNAYMGWADTMPHADDRAYLSREGFGSIYETHQYQYICELFKGKCA